jgi:hypothetical protein
MSSFGEGGNGSFRGVVQQDEGQVTLAAPATAGALTCSSVKPRSGCSCWMVGSIASPGMTWMR